MASETEIEAEEIAEAQLLLDEMRDLISGHPVELVTAALCGALIGAVIHIENLEDAEWQIANLDNVALHAVRDHWHLLIAARAGGAN